jgi:hypothetical protein
MRVWHCFATPSDDRADCPIGLSEIRQPVSARDIVPLGCRKPDI